MAIGGGMTGTPDPPGSGDVEGPPELEALGDAEPEGALDGVGEGDGLGLGVGLGLGDGLALGEVDAGIGVAVGATAPIGPSDRSEATTGPSVTVTIAVAAAASRMRAARRTPARRTGDAAMQPAPYPGAPAGTIPAVSTPLTAPALLRDVGLLADGPVPWGRPVPARGRGVFLIELPAPRATAPLELTRVGKWLEHVPTLTLDGKRPTSKALAARLASFWRPESTVLYIGATEVSIGARVAAMQKTALGDRRPHSGGHWLHTLSVLPTTRIWWTETDAVEEYEDALFGAFADAAGHDDVLPFANLRRPAGERRASGISGSILVEPVAAPAPPTTVRVLPDGDAEGAHGEPPPRRSSVGRGSVAGGRGGTSRAAGSRSATPAATLTAEGADRLQAELTQLTKVRRPEVVARIRAAKELGDLKENADYHAAREEQSFLEGRIQALEARLREAVIATAPVAGSSAGLGSKVRVEIDGDEVDYTLVGSAEADPASGRLSILSPVGKALVGAEPGAQVMVQTPRGQVAYRVVSVE